MSVFPSGVSYVNAFYEIDSYKTISRNFLFFRQVFDYDSIIYSYLFYQY